MNESSSTVNKAAGEFSHVCVVLIYLSWHF